MNKTGVEKSLRKMVEAHGGIALKGLLDKYGASNLSDIDEADYVAITTEAKNYGVAHAPLSPSSASRWSACTASAQAESQYPNESSPYAIEGTVAHAMIEICLKESLTPGEVTLKMLKNAVKEWKGENGIPEDMQRAVQVCLNVVKMYREESGENHTISMEMKVPLDFVIPGQFGTIDICIFDPDNSRLIIIDYKHGAGVWVEVDNNKQLIEYGAGGLHSTGENHRLYKTIETVIVQPRCFKVGESGVRTKTYTHKQIQRFSKELNVAAEKAIGPDAEFVPGTHCKFCRHAANCSALRAVAKQAMTYDEDGNIINIETMTEEELGIAHSLVEDYIKPWTNSIWGAINRKLENGVVVPGWKRVAKIGQRKWIDEAETVKELKKLGLKDIYSDPKLLSPAQIEKVKTENKKEVKEIVNSLVTKKSSGYNVVKAEDSRKEVPGTNAEQAFGKIEGETKE